MSPHGGTGYLAGPPGQSLAHDTGAGTIAATDRILTLGITLTDPLLSALAADDLTCEPCAGADDLCARLAEGAAVVLLTEDALDVPTRARLAGAIAAQEEWSDLPVVLLVSDNADPRVVSEGLGNVRLVERNARPIMVASALNTARRARLRQYALRDRAVAARESAEHFRTLVTHAPVPIFVKDLAGRYVVANAPASKALGRPEGVEGLTDHELLPADVADDLRQRDLEVVATGRATQGEESVRRPGLDRRYLSLKFPLFDVHGRVVQVCGVAVDITDRKRAEDAIRASEEHLRLLADSIPQLAWMARPDGHVVWFNKRWLEYTGEPLETMLGWGWQSAVDPAELPRVEMAWRTALADECPCEVTYPLRRHDGAMRWHLTRAVPIRDERGHVTRWFGTNTDIAEQHELEDTLREADRRKDEFLATLAHELRNPLAPLRTSLEILRLAGDDPVRLESVAGVMERQVDHLVRLVDDLLEVSRITRGQIELRRSRVALADIVTSGVETSRPLIEAAGHELTVDLPIGELVLDADAMRLGQVIANLLNNAAKYTENGGHIQLWAERHGETVEIGVRDDGIGIQKPMLASVFDMFAQDRRAKQRAAGGLGIGLTLVRTLVELHGGRVAARSDGPGRGSEFVIQLPLAPRVTTTVPSSLAAGDVRPSEGDRVRVLVVDDNSDVGDSLAALLGLLGFAVDIARDGPSAIEIGRRARPALVLLDLGMPGMDGYETARRMREIPTLRDTTFVALTGWGQDEARRRSREAGFAHHLVKPVGLAALRAVLPRS